MIKLPKLKYHFSNLNYSAIIEPLDESKLTVAQATEIIRRVEQYNPWIPVSERLPDVGQTVDVWLDLKTRVTSFKWSSYWKGAFAPHSITHWKPIILPEAEAEK